MLKPMACLFAMICTSPLIAAERFVSGGGNDGNDGSSTSTAFLTLQKAATLVNPGDTVWVLNGTYVNGWPGGNVLDLNRSGNPAAWITWKAYPGQQPELHSTGWCAINVRANYQRIEGLLVTGNNDAVTLAQAEADAANVDPDSRFNGTGIAIDSRSVADKFHHLTVRNCTICKFGGGGLSAIQADYITWEDNLVYDNSWYTRYGNSGISPYQAWNFDQADGYHIIIRRNRVWNNRGLVKWHVINDFSDGNGIIIDDLKNTQNGSTLGSYTGRTLVSDNVCFNNGGSGIHAFESEHVDIVNNTAYDNGQKVAYAEIFSNNSNDVRILNNIMVARTGGSANSDSGNTNVTYDYNVYWNGSTSVVGPHDLVADPRMVMPSTDPRIADFQLQPGSPALDSGIQIAGVTSISDFAGSSRPQGSGIDRGAYEKIVAPASIGVGTGLSGTYFSGPDFSGSTVTRTDPTIDFDWGTASPLAGIGTDNFSVRWTGQVQAQFTESYTFSTVSDDGIRLWVDGRLVIDNWTDHAPTENRGSILLNAGQKYALKLEYFENSGGAVARLWWESASTVKRSVPTSQLYPAQVPITVLPVGWSALDIGVVGAAGSSSQANGLWTVIGSGDDIWNMADSFQFVSRPVTGDVMITARVTGLTNTDAWAKAGVMVRESLAPESRHASTFATAGNGLTFQRRLSPGGASSHTAGPGKSAPQWVRIERIANSVISSTSVDGTAWTEIRRQTITMTPTVYVGLAVTSHRRGTLCTATLTNVQVVAATLSNN